MWNLVIFVFFMFLLCSFSCEAWSIFEIRSLEDAQQRDDGTLSLPLSLQLPPSNAFAPAGGVAEGEGANYLCEVTHLSY